ncbi:Methylthioribose-1-phosphate isomerase [Bifiguratus adelaidae]|uniref:Methylthioribose-1-phosphate isomerase n=1 Tax=Bifiguratus adelaidae TaxID=1938954 RepID=A0A261Y6H8_9FUNG|nr:Methylthioribose-1-phosphate isomerase [Bifiguratus adelaidae]
MTLEAIRYNRGSLSILDQLRLPHQTTYVPIKNSQDGHAAIKTMQVRGAPAIAIVAALSLAVELVQQQGTSPFPDAAGAVKFIVASLDYLKTSRPTAVNLFDAAKKLQALVERVGDRATTGEEVVDAYVAAAEQMLVDDVKDNQNIGRFGAEWLLQQAPDKVQVLTHCNTGSLATAGWGTALGIIRDLHKAGQLKHAYCTETRPYNQGSRLTAYELVYESIPATLICDNMASALMQQQPIAAVVVGADRVAANGDTANKIGTYQLAIVAKHHNVKFIVTAPSTSVDLNTASGKDIHIEQRKPNEVTTLTGAVIQSIDEEPKGDVHSQLIRVAANGIGVWNPSFDVTPAQLISAIVTEVGVVEKAEGSDVFDMKSFLTAHGKL